ncbi:hypothetical protein HZA45_00765 [Candidatus Peregrinibacteria bacterium]|nr:hypothetical protein [Candidatus Peregrinibacteria bacterium]
MQHALGPAALGLAIVAIVAVYFYRKPVTLENTLFAMAGAIKIKRVRKKRGRKTVSVMSDAFGKFKIEERPDFTTILIKVSGCRGCIRIWIGHDGGMQFRYSTWFWSTRRQRIHEADAEVIRRFVARVRAAIETGADAKARV